MVPLRAHATAKFLPATDKQGPRFVVQVGAYRKKVMGEDLVPEMDRYAELAQALVELRMQELGVLWKIKSASILHNGVYVFIME